MKGTELISQLVTMVIRHGDIEVRADHAKDGEIVGMEFTTHENKGVIMLLD